MGGRRRAPAGGSYRAASSTATGSAAAAAAAAAVVATAASSTVASRRGSRPRTNSSAEFTAADLGLMLALYQNLLGQLGTNVDSRRARDDLYGVRTRAWDQVNLACQQHLTQQQPQQPQALSLLIESVNYFADLLLVTHRLTLRFPVPAADLQQQQQQQQGASGGSAGSCTAPIPVGLHEGQRLPGGHHHHHHHGRLSATSTAADSMSAWNPLADADRARSLADSLRQQQSDDPQQQQQQQQQQQLEETWSALIRTDSSDSFDSYVCRHEPVLLEIHTGTRGRRRRCIALIAVVLVVVITFAAVLGICITLLAPRQPP